MKANKSFLGLMASGLVLAGLTQSCISDAPFADGDASGSLRMQLVVNSDLTRAETNVEELLEKCNVYISGPQGLLYKYESAAELPDLIPLKSGSYTAEAWTGDSVPASFTKKFYRGYQKFDIQKYQERVVMMKCKIANVAVNIDPSTIQEDAMTDWKVTVGNSTGSLEFNSENVADATGYFMMSSRDIAYGEDGNVVRESDGWPMYTNLRYTVEGTTADGRPFSKTGLISSPDREDDFVAHAHLYTLKFVYNPQYDELGGSFITIVVDDSEDLVKDEIGLYSRPSITGVGFDIHSQVIGNEGLFTDKIVKVAGFNGVTGVKVSCGDAAMLDLPDEFDLLNLGTGVEDELKAKGVEWSYVDRKSENKDKSDLCYVTFKKSLLDRMAQRDTEYRINLFVTDGNGRTNEAVLRVAVGEGAVVIEDPVTLNPMPANDNLAVRSTYATVTGTINSDDALPKLLYRVYGTDAWEEIYLGSQTRATASTFSYRLEGLSPNTHYEYALRSGDFTTDIYEFTTEEKFEIPNANMESWSTYDGIIFPGTGSAATFWDTGNKGASMGRAVLTNEDHTMYHPGIGNTSAKLLTQKVLNLVIAAGNLFSGKFEGTSGTSGASLTFGRPFGEGSHPDALKVWAHYRPAKVNSSKEHANLKKNEPDHGQVYIAITSDEISFNTAKSEYFEAENPSWTHYNKVLGYGQVTWEGEDFGPDNGLAEIVIPIKWRDVAKTAKATRIVIVASASKYGDYFVGGSGSVLYLDDFELVYDADVSGN